LNFEALSWAEELHREFESYFSYYESLLADTQRRKPVTKISSERSLASSAVDEETAPFPQAHAHPHEFLADF
jgi:hypothetical protein